MFKRILSGDKVIKNGIRIIRRKGLYYMAGRGDRPLKFKPWLGDCFAFLYDGIMEKSVFPRKLGAELKKHEDILGAVLAGVHQKRILELATGSGSAARFLPRDNQYTGTDISPGLLKKAVVHFRKAGFRNASFYITGAENLPFADNAFDVVLCILALNFFNDIDQVFEEIKRVTSPDGVFICSVPVPERKKVQSSIHGTLYSEEELQRICKAHGFYYETIDGDNGALLYFRAVKK